MQRKEVTKKGQPTRVDRGTSNVEGIERGDNLQGKIRKKRDRGAGMQAPTGTWGAG